MMGAKKDFTTLMKQSSPDLVSIHCLAHRLELAIKDAIKGNITVKKSYDRLMTLFIGLYYLYKKSPKQRKLLQKTFEILKVPTMFPTRAGGTRWIPHTLKAISVLMKNYVPITTQLQDASHSVPKAEGLVKLATDVNLFAFMMVMQDLLEPVNTLSMHLQGKNTTIADAFFMMETTKELIESYGNENSDELKDVCSSKTYKGVTLKGNTPPLKYRELLVQNVLKSLEGRFSGDRELFKSAQIVNFVAWPSAQDRTQILAFGNQEVKYLQSHFAGRFDDDVNLLPQWRRLKTLVYQRYGTAVEALDWEEVNRALRNQDVDGILSLVDLILSLPPTSVYNERAFSHMKLIKGERRARLSSDAMSDVMMVKTQAASVKEFNPDAAITRFLTKTPLGGQRRPYFCRKPKPSKVSEEEAEPNLDRDGASGCVHDLDQDDTEQEHDDVDSESDNEEFDESTLISKLTCVVMEIEKERENV